MNIYQDGIAFLEWLGRLTGVGYAEVSVLLNIYVAWFLLFVTMLPMLFQCRKISAGDVRTKCLSIAFGYILVSNVFVMYSIFDIISIPSIIEQYHALRVLLKTLARTSGLAYSQVVLAVYVLLPIMMVLLHFWMYLTFRRVRKKEIPSLTFGDPFIALWNFIWGLFKLIIFLLFVCFSPIGILISTKVFKSKEDLTKDDCFEEDDRYFMQTDSDLFKYMVVRIIRRGTSSHWWLLKDKQEEFDFYDVNKIAAYQEDKINTLERAFISTGSSSGSAKMKINAIVCNAKIFLQIIEKYGSYDAYIRHFILGNKVPVSQFQGRLLSKVISADMRRQGMKMIDARWIYDMLVLAKYIK